MLLGEVCKFYGWTDEYCLSMPAVRFFAMLKASRIMYLKEKIDQIDISVIPSCDEKYFSAIRRTYTSALEAILDEQEVTVEQDAPRSNALDAGSEEARAAMFEIFTAAKGNRQ